MRQIGESIEQSLAVRIPDALASASQNDLEEEIEGAELEFSIFSGNSEDSDRWPEIGWLDGSVDELAGCIEHAALSENRIARGMEILELGIDQAAGKLRDAYADAPDTLDSLGATSQHDLCGRMLQRLITDRKFLATFYTLPSSATLLADLAVARLDVH